MTKHILEFQLPEESEELKTAMNAGAYHSAMWDFAMLLRSMVKHGGNPFEQDKALNKIQLDFAEKLQQKFYEILRENDVDGDF